MKITLIACPWVKGELYVEYHNKEWGSPCFDENKLFEKLCLEGQQAGLSWIMVLKKRDKYREQFFNFNPIKIAKMTDSDIELRLTDTGLIRNKLKLYSIRSNAIAFLEMKKQGESFVDFIWGFVGNTVQLNQYETLSQVPAETTESAAMSKALKKRGFKFIGPTICYAFMQSMGLINDHLTNCPQHPNNDGQKSRS
jgi:DNA-3-methyladenine glycosylase I